MRNPKIKIIDCGMVHSMAKDLGVVLDLQRQYHCVCACSVRQFLWWNIPTEANLELFMELQRRAKLASTSYSELLQHTLGAKRPQLEPLLQKVSFPKKDHHKRNPSLSSCPWEPGLHTGVTRKACVLQKRFKSERGHLNCKHARFHVGEAPGACATPLAQETLCQVSGTSQRKEARTCCRHRWLGVRAPEWFLETYYSCFEIIFNFF